MTGRLRIGLCGAGSFALTRCRALRQLEEVEVVLGWSRSEVSRQRFHEQTGVPMVEDWQRLCGDERIQAVIVCSVNTEHFRHAQAALQAGKHVLVETPFSLRHGEARELATLAHEHGLVAHHGVVPRYHPNHPDRLAWYRGIGRLLHAVQHAGFDGGPERRWYADPGLSGGARCFLPYVLSHWLEAFGGARATGGVQAEYGRRQTAAMTVRFDDGGAGIFSYSLGEGVGERALFLAEGSEGSLQEIEGRNCLVRGETTTALSLPEIDGVLAECRAFVDEVLGRRDHLPDLRLDLQALELVDGALGP